MRGLFRSAVAEPPLWYGAVKGQSSRLPTHGFSGQQSGGFAAALLNISASRE